MLALMVNPAVDHSVMPRGIDPKLTEAYLMHCHDVLDASVIWHQGELRAFVTIQDDDAVDDRLLQRRCLEDLGLHQTPRAITLILAHPRTRSRAA